MMTLIIAKLTTVVLEFEKLTHSNVYKYLMKSKNGDKTKIS